MFYVALSNVHGRDGRFSIFPLRIWKKGTEKDDCCERLFRRRDCVCFARRLAASSTNVVSHAARRTTRFRTSIND